MLLLLLLLIASRGRLLLRSLQSVERGKKVDTNSSLFERGARNVA